MIHNFYFLNYIQIHRYTPLHLDTYFLEYILSVYITRNSNNSILYAIFIIILKSFHHNFLQSILDILSLI